MGNIRDAFQGPVGSDWIRVLVLLDGNCWLRRLGECWFGRIGWLLVVIVDPGLVRLQWSVVRCRGRPGRGHETGSK